MINIIVYYKDAITCVFVAWFCNKLLAFCQNMLQKWRKSARVISKCYVAANFTISTPMGILMGICGGHLACLRPYIPGMGCDSGRGGWLRKWLRWFVAKLILKFFCYNQIIAYFCRPKTLRFQVLSGEVAEWSIAAVLKTVEVWASGGSNPSLSAKSPGSRRLPAS